MVKKAELPSHIVAVALDLAAEKGWSRIGLDEIAAAAKIPPAELRGLYASKSAILAGFSRLIDAEILAGGDVFIGAGDAAATTPRERLFEVVMRRYDALAPYKAGIAAVLRGTDPLTALCAAPGYMRAMAAMLEFAGIGAGGITGPLRVKGLALLYADTTRIWLRDDSPDLGRTMARLDRRLAQVEGLLLAIARRRGGESSVIP